MRRCASARSRRRSATSSRVCGTYVAARTRSDVHGPTLAPGMRRLTGSDLFDVALGASLAAALLAITRGIDAAEGERLLDALAYACLVVAGESLALRRRFPAVALLLASAAVGVYAARSYPGGPIFVMPLVGVYSVAGLWP